ncbi:MAG: alanine racemase, partial [Granulosicoccaceae bacterium]
MQADSRTLEIDLDIITGNAAQVVGFCADHSIDVCGVTKATCGSPMVARAMLKGGVTSLGESRIDNAKRLRYGGVHDPLWMLRIPSPSEAEEVVRLFDLSLNTEIDTLDALNKAALDQGKQHDVLVMLEMGDRREGVLDEELIPLCEAVEAMVGLKLAGIGANFMCVSGILPTAEKMQRIASAAENVQQVIGRELQFVSAGNSANLAMMDSPPPSIINHLRVGASILRGENALTGGTLDWLQSGAFRLQAELVEIQHKHSLPEGTVGRDAFGGVPEFVDDGEQLRGIVNLGRLDMRHEGLTPETDGVEVVAASSDHLVLDLNHNRHFDVGDSIAFQLDYGALTQAMLSPYVSKVLVNRRQRRRTTTVIDLQADSALLHTESFRAFESGLHTLGLRLGRDKHALPLTIASDRANEPDLHDMEYGVLCLDSEPGDVAHFSPESTALFGLREASSAQAALIHERELLAHTMEDIDLRGAHDCIREAIRQVNNGTDGFAMILHASVGGGMFDDPDHMGLSYRECSLVMERIAATRQLKAVTLSGIDASSEEKTLKRAFAFVLSALGKRIL